VPLWGLISTSLNKEVALGFAESDDSEGKRAVLYHIRWSSQDSDCRTGLCYMDEKYSVYANEKEVLFGDGRFFFVNSIKK
jgi:hypothetical protein